MRRFNTPQYRIVGVYIVVAGLWIYFSDRLIGLALHVPEEVTHAQNLKGWVFVALTGLLLFQLIRRQFLELQRKHDELVESYDQTIDGWVSVMDARHQETRGHTDRVTRMTVAFAMEAGIDDETELTTIRRGATLHDIGKIGIPDSVLIKPGRLDDEEWRIIKRHPDIAADILARIQHLSPCVHIPYCHHERWDGSGYPQGLTGKDIPLPARLFAIVDVWDALVHERVYKSAWPEDKVLQHIADQAETHFDPELAALFVRRYDRIKAEAGVDSLDSRPSVGASRPETAA